MYICISKLLFHNAFVCKVSFRGGGGHPMCFPLEFGIQKTDQSYINH